MTTNETTLIDNDIALVLSEQGPPIETPGDFNDLIGEAMGAGATLLAIPKNRLSETFFDLRSGLAGELAQKCVNYRIRLVVLGDIESEVAGSAALRDFVREANRGRQIRFARTLAELNLDPH